MANSTAPLANEPGDSLGTARPTRSAHTASALAARAPNTHSTPRPTGSGAAGPAATTPATAAATRTRRRPTDTAGEGEPSGGPVGESGALTGAKDVSTAASKGSTSVPAEPLYRSPVYNVKEHLMARRATPRGLCPSGGSAPEYHAQRDHAHAEDEVQPVVGGVERYEVGPARVAGDQPVEPQHQVDHPATNEVPAGRGDLAGQRETGHAEEQVHDVVQDRDLEDAEQQGAGVVTGERHAAVVRGQARDEPRDADHKEDRADHPGGRTDEGTGSGSVRVRDVGHHATSDSSAASGAPARPNRRSGAGTGHGVIIRPGTYRNLWPPSRPHDAVPLKFGTA